MPLHKPFTIGGVGIGAADDEEWLVNVTDDYSFESVKITDNHFLGPSEKGAGVVIGKNVSINRMFICTLSTAYVSGILFLIGVSGGRWIRFWRAVARFALRRIG